MNFTSFYQAFDKRDVISIYDINKRFPEFDSRRLNEWQKKGYIQKIINKYYTWPDNPTSEARIFFTANRLCSNSYISLWSALRWYGFIPEGVYQTFSVTTKQTHSFETPLGHFHYQHVKPALLFGYRPERLGERTYLIAEPEKAILDTFYLNADIRNEKDLDGLRLNFDIMAEKLSSELITKYAITFQNQRVCRLTNIIKNRLTHD